MSYASARGEIVRLSKVTARSSGLGELCGLRTLLPLPKPFPTKTVDAPSIVIPHWLDLEKLSRTPAEAELFS